MKLSLCIIIFMIEFIHAEWVEKIPLKWTNYSMPDLQIFYYKLAPGGWYTDVKKTIYYPIPFPDVPKVIVSIQQITHSKIYGMVSYHLKVSVNIQFIFIMSKEITNTQFTCEGIHSGAYSNYRNWIFIFATTNKDIEVGNIYMNRANSFQSASNKFQRTFNYQNSKVYSKIPKVQIFTTGYTVNPIISTNIESNSQGLRQEAKIIEVTQSTFTVEFSYLSQHYNGIFEFYASYIAFEETRDLFDAIDSPAKWKMEVETGIARQQTRLKMKQLEAKSEDVDTGNLYISTIFWGISGYHSPAYGGECQDGFVAIYAHVQLVDYKYVFFIEGNPNPCVTNWLFMGQISYMLFKYAYCEDPYFLEPVKKKECVRCHPHCKHCIGYKIDECTMCWNNMTLDMSKGNTFTIDSGDILNYGTCWCDTPREYYRELRCYKCHYTCEECITEGQYACQKCSSDTRVKNKFNQCGCKEGYYKSFKAKCGKCHDDCKTCIGPSKNECLKCKLDQFHNTTLIIGNVEKGCGQCGCLSGQFIQKSSSTSYCYPCHETCKECLFFTQIDCIKCFKNKQLKQMSTVNIEAREIILGSCECLEGYQQKSLECIKCHDTCKYCRGLTQGNCTECYADKELKILYQKYNTGYCGCKSNQYTGFNGFCGDCHNTCLTCAGSEMTDCILCKPGLVFKFIKIDFILKYESQDLVQVGICGCSIRQFLNKEYKCEPCHEYCIECIEKKEEDCLICDNQLKRELTPEQKCSCIPGYYDQKIQELPVKYMCLECSQICLTCKGKHDFCLECKRIRINPPDCSCPKSYYEDDKYNCQPCHPACITCKGPGDKECFKCSQGLVFKEGKCKCEKVYQQMNVFTNICEDAFNLTYSTEFTLYQNYQNIILQFDQQIYSYDETKVRLLEELECQSWDQQLINSNISIDCFNASKSHFIITNQTMQQIENLKNCSYQLWLHSFTTKVNQIIYRLNYSSFFDKISINIVFKDPEQLIVRNGTPLALAYSQINKIKIEVGPYCRITNDTLKDTKYRLLAEHFYQSKYNPSVFLNLLKDIYLIPMLFPTIWGLTVILQINPNMPQNLYFFLNSICQFTFKNISDYSFQVRKQDIRPETYLSIIFNRRNLIGNYNSTQKELQNLGITSIFLYDADQILLFLFFYSLIGSIANKILNKSQKIMLSRPKKFILYFFQFLKYSYIKSNLYILILYAILQVTQLQLNNIINITGIIISIMSIIQFIYYLIAIFYITTEIIYANIKMTKLINKNFMDNYENLKTTISEQNQYTINKIKRNYYNYLSFYSLFGGLKLVFYNIYLYSKNSNLTSFFKIISLVQKRLCIALLIGLNAGNKREKLILLLIIEIGYLVFKIYTNPYQKFAILIFKLIGDIFYILALIFIFVIHTLLDDQFNIFRTDEQCTQIQNVDENVFQIFSSLLYHQSNLYFTLGWITALFLLLFIFFYLLNMIIEAILICKNNIPQNVTITQIEKSIIPVVPYYQTYESIQIEEEIAPPPVIIQKEKEPQFIISRYKLIDQSKLFNYGISIENEYLQIKWRSKIIKDDLYLGSTGVRYFIAITNKSEIYICNFQQLSIKTIEFELTKDILEQKDVKSLPPLKTKTFELEIYMKFASLDIYEDRFEITGKWKLQKQNFQQEEIFLKLCTSELKLLESIDYSYQNFLDDQLQGQMMEVILQKDNLCYDQMYLQYLLVEYKALDFFTMRKLEKEDTLENQKSFLIKFQTHFHSYAQLQFYLEIKLKDYQDQFNYQQTCQILLLANAFDKNLIANSGYEKVLEEFLNTIQKFIYPDEINIQKYLL